MLPIYLPTYLPYLSTLLTYLSVGAPDQGSITLSLTCGHLIQPLYSSSNVQDKVILRGSYVEEKEKKGGGMVVR